MSLSDAKDDGDVLVPHAGYATSLRRRQVYCPSVKASHSDVSILNIFAPAPGIHCGPATLGTPWQRPPPSLRAFAPAFAIVDKIRYLEKMKPSPAPPTTIANCPDFWERVSAAPARFLGLDYDGTLAPFHVDPMQARPLAGVLEILPALINHSATSVAIISGRPLKWRGSSITRQ